MVVRSCGEKYGLKVYNKKRRLFINFSETDNRQERYLCRIPIQNAKYWISPPASGAMKKTEPAQTGRYLVPAVYFFLVVLGIPWYLPTDSVIVVLGFPLWVFISLLVAFIGTLFTAWLYLFRLR